MRVRELIKLLDKFEPESEVRISETEFYIDGDGYGDSDIIYKPIEDVYGTMDGIVVIES